MAIIRFNTEWIIDRLKSQATGFKFIGGAADMEAAEKSASPKPAALVLRVSESATGSKTGTMVVQQQNTVQFWVVTATKNLKDARGQEAQAEHSLLLNSISDALHGWTPHEDFTPIEFAGGNALGFTDQVFWWRDTFLTKHSMRSV